MNYHDGTPAALGDLVNVPVPGGSARGRIVLLGDTRDHLALDAEMLAWLTHDSELDASTVVIEWVDGNPFAHSDPRFAPVANYTFATLDEDLTRVT